MNKIGNLKINSFQVYDFSTLYTNLNQNRIIEHLFALFDLIFNSSNRKFLCIRWDKSFLASKTYNSFTCFDVNLFKDAVRYVIKEVYVTFGGLVFKQIRGIPMGGACSPLLADLFLAHCEFIFMTSLIKDKKFGLARLLSNTSRYIDDLMLINYKHFDTLVNKIYPVDLLAERSGDDDKNVDYLDVNLSIVSEGLRTSVFHKVDNFNFPVILLTFPNSLIPVEMGYRVFAGQVIRYLRICSNVEDFVSKTKKSAKLLIDRGYSSDKLQTHMEKMLFKHNLLYKYNLTSCREVSRLIGLCNE